jgi:hypothetical protein
MRSDIWIGLSKTYAWVITLGLEHFARVLQFTQGAPRPFEARMVQIFGYQRSVVRSNEGDAMSLLFHHSIVAVVQ